MRALLLIALIATACVDAQPVETRDCNRTGFEIANSAPYETAVYAVQANDTCTEYRVATTEMYAYTGASFYIGTDRFDRIPVDFVGEPPLTPGRWSYEIRIVDYSTRTISTNAVRDDALED